MGYHRHDAVIAIAPAGALQDAADEARQAIVDACGDDAAELAGLQRLIVGPLLWKDGHEVLVQMPDGSKEGWEPSDVMDHARESLMRALDGAGATWAWISFGGDWAHDQPDDGQPAPRRSGGLDPVPDGAVLIALACPWSHQDRLSAHERLDAEHRTRAPDVLLLGPAIGSNGYRTWIAFADEPDAAQDAVGAALVLAYEDAGREQIGRADVWEADWHGAFGAEAFRTRADANEP